MTLTELTISGTWVIYSDPEGRIHIRILRVEDETSVANGNGVDTLAIKP